MCEYTSCRYVTFNCVNILQIDILTAFRVCVHFLSSSNTSHLYDDIIKPCYLPRYIILLHYVRITLLYGISTTSTSHLPYTWYIYICAYMISINQYHIYFVRITCVINTNKINSRSLTTYVTLCVCIKLYI